MNNLVQIFFDTADRFPDHTAIIHKSDEISYAELRQNVELTSRYLASKGIIKNTKVLVFVPMSIKLYQTVLALFSIGAIVVFVDEWADRKRLEKALTVVGVDAVIAPKKYLWLGYLLRMLKGIPLRLGTPSKRKLRRYTTGRLFINENEGNPVLYDDTALITFTTGSTGLPKAANRTHGFLRAQFEVLSKEIDARPDDICLVTLPIVLLSILGTGATGVIADFNQSKPEKLNSDKQRKVIKAMKVSMLIASPYFVERLSSKEKAAFSSVRKVLTGGAPVFPKLAQSISKTFENALCLVAYGSTEAEPISVVDMKNVKVTEEGLAVGKVNSEISLKIIKITDEEVCLGKQGWAEWETDFGEIVVAGPHVLANYYNSEDAFRLNKIVDGEVIWHRTGDSGRLVDGQLFLNGRCSQLIKKDNEYLSLFILEHQLSQISDVEIGTIIGNKVILELKKVSNHKDKINLPVIKSQIGPLSNFVEDIVIMKNIPRDPRHHSKIDYDRLEQMIKNKESY